MSRRQMTRSVATVVLVVLGLAPAAFAQVQVPPEVAQQAQINGSARVIVQLDLPVQPEGQLAQGAVAFQRQAIAAAQAQLLAGLTGTYQVLRQFETIPFVVLQAAPDALTALASSLPVVAIQEDRLEAASLSQSVPIVEGPGAWAAGYDGTGWTIAVLDTGVASGHPFLSGKVVSEACYSVNSNCPNGATTQLGPGAGAPCTYAASGCRHGTHVAGIAAGRSTTFSGVARGATVIAIQVFSRFTGANCVNAGEDPCALTALSDQIAALERVLTLRSSLNIAAVNMSLGGGRYTSQAACDADNAARKLAIDNLRSVGIAAVISSGNSGFTDALGAPGCISSAVSVGSTTKSDVVSSFSNSATFLALLAPGSAITSSVPGNGFAAFDGTSMAAPHVAGAWAIIKQRAPSASVTSVLSALRTRGLPVTDFRNGITVPRIRILQALGAFNNSALSISDASLVEGQTGTMNLTFTATLSEPSTGAVTVNYATADGTATSGGTTTTVTNAAPIAIPEGGAASPYPSTITVPNGLGAVTKVRVTLHGFSHTWTDDVDVLLVGPNGQTSVLMSDVGSNSNVSGLTLTFDDAGPVLTSAPLTAGTYRPTNLEGAEVFPTPAPPGPYGSALAGFIGTDPAGTWRLFVVDDTQPDAGTIAGGWSLTISAGLGSDYNAVSGTITFAPGTTSASVAVGVNGDSAFEIPETFTMNLSGAAGAIIADGVGIGLIRNDDFTDQQLSAGLIVKTTHIHELRTMLNAVRALRGLAPFPFSDPVLTPQGSRIRAAHIIELRSAVPPACAPAFTDPVLVAGVTPMRAVHVTEIRVAAMNCQ